MKKIYALILSLLLVFAIAGVASASLNVAVSGSASVHGEYDFDDTEWYWWVGDSSSFVDLAFSAAFGEHAKANMLLTISYNGAPVSFATFDYTYTFSDSFALGVIYNDVDMILAYASPILFTGDEWGFYVPDEEEAFFAKFALGPVKGTLYVNGEFTDDLGFAGAVTVGLDAATINAGFFYDIGWEYGVGADAAFKVGEKWTVSAAAALWQNTWGDWMEWEVGLKGAYAGDVLSADAWVSYYQDVDSGVLDWDELVVGADISAEVVPDMVTLSGGIAFDVFDAYIEGFFVKAAVVFNENISAWALYQQGSYYSGDYNDGLWIQGDFKIDTVNTLSIWYQTDWSEIGLLFTVNF